MTRRPGSMMTLGAAGCSGCRRVLPARHLQCFVLLPDPSYDAEAFPDEADGQNFEDEEIDEDEVRRATGGRVVRVGSPVCG